MELAVQAHASSHVTHTDVEIHHDSGLQARGCPGTGGVGEARGYPGTGGVGGRACKVDKSGTRVSRAWSERQDQILRNTVDPYRDKIIP